MASCILHGAFCFRRFYEKHIVFPFILCMCMFLTSCGVKMTGVKIQNVGELTTGDRQSLVLDYEFNHDGSDKEKEKVIDKTQLIFPRTT